MSASSVVFVARCDGCGGDARWSGCRLEPGGATGYVVTCPGCGVAGNDGISGSNPGHSSVPFMDPPRWMNDYWARLLNPGRRTA